MSRYLDYEGICSHPDKALYIELYQVEYDEELKDTKDLRAGDVIITSPYSAVNWSWLPRTIKIETVPETGVEPKRVSPLRYGLQLQGVRSDKIAPMIKNPPSERSTYRTKYDAAIKWSADHSLSDIWIGDSVYPYELVTDPIKALAIVNSLKGRLYCIDYETTGDPLHIIEGVAFADDKMSWYLAGAALRVLPAIRNLLCSTAGIAHSAIYEYKVSSINSAGTLRPLDMVPLYDTRVINWMLDNKPGANNLKFLAKTKLGRDVLTFTDVVPEGTDIRDVDPERIARYAAGGDARNTYDLFIKLRDEAKAAGIWDVYEEVERPLTPVLAEMELAGIPYDRETLNSLTAFYVGRRAVLRQGLTDLGYTGQVIDPDHIAQWFYDDLGLPIHAMTESGSRGKVDTPTLALLSGTHPAVDAYLAYQEVEGVLDKFMFPLMKRPGNMLYPEVSQTSTRTGRLSYKNPNLQQLPARKNPEVRKLIRAIGQDVVWSADYHAQEPRILSVIANDVGLKQAFINGDDVYIRLGLDMGLSLEKAKSIRQDLKIAFLGWIYGDYTEYTAKLNASRPAVTQWRKDTIRQAHIDLASYSLNGRRRLLPALGWRDPKLVASAEREATNMWIQGTASDVTKLSMISVGHLLREHNMPVRIIQIHDELVGFQDKKWYEEVGREEIISRMENVYPRVPLKVEIHSGESWYDAKY